MRNLNRARKQAPPTDAEEQADALLEILHLTTGVEWEWYWADNRLLGVPGCWQLMLANPLDEDAFWNWHVANNRQWFDSQKEATLSLLESRQRFLATEANAQTAPDQASERGAP